MHPVVELPVTSGGTKSDSGQASVLPCPGLINARVLLLASRWVRSTEAPEADAAELSGSAEVGSPLSM